MNNRQTGTEKEALAVTYLQERGLQVLEKNFRARQGEIDIIGKHEGYLVFVEVKYRSSTARGNAAEAVDIKKQRQICKVGDYYRLIHGISDYAPVRYDVVAIQEDEIQWIQNAFPHRYRYR